MQQRQGDSLEHQEHESGIIGNIGERLQKPNALRPSEETSVTRFS